MLIICNGVFKSGSTWLHAIVTELLFLRDIKISTINKKLPSRDTIAIHDGRWVRSKTHWEENMTSEEVQLFNILNYSALKEFGYE